MDHTELSRQIEKAREEHHQFLKNYRRWYHVHNTEEDDGFRVLRQLPESVAWVLEEDVLQMKGSMKGLQEMTFIIQAFAHDADVVGLFYQGFVLLKDAEPHNMEGLVVIAMPEDVWAFWGGKMADVAWGNDFPDLTFNSLGFYEETLPVDIGIVLLEDPE